MYTLYCDGYPLLDWRDPDLIVAKPKVRLEVNTVGEGSFTIYKDHPNYDKMKKMKSIFEVADEMGVIFRGRATGETVDFDHGTAVDLEGVMAFFNDSIVRPYAFPDDFLTDADYIAATNGGNVVEYLLKLLIDNHNAQTQPFQHMKLGNVTVRDPNNYIVRSNVEYSSTWDTLRTKLFESSLGGYICIRYEDDGNYIDYLSEFTLSNSQKIVFGENLLDLKSETEASKTYSAIVPQGAERLTITSLPDGDITDDIVKIGDTVYSKKAVENYGWIYAPMTDSRWDDVTVAENLLSSAIKRLEGSGIMMSNTIEVKAVDLHFTDDEIMSLRIYRNVEVVSNPHGLEETYPLAMLKIDLLNPQNTAITVGNTKMTFTDKTSVDIDSVIQEVNKNTQDYFDSVQIKVVESVKAELEPDEYRVFGEVSGLTVNLVPVYDDKVHEYMFEFIPTETFQGMTIVPEVRFPIKPEFTAGKVHQVSVLRGIGVMISA